jgi:anti-sigma regulatory factor (Ser/Thr protein kinase)
MRMFLGPDTKAPGVARRVLRGGLEGVVDPELLDRATLLLSELVTNSVRHAGLRPGERIEVTVTASGASVRVEVTEPGEGFEVTEAREPRRDPHVGGWGLYLVDRLSSAWGVVGGEETRVWFEVDDRPPGRALDARGKGPGAGRREAGSPPAKR